MGGGITPCPKRGSQRHGARVELLFLGVVHLVRYLDELIEVLLHARLLGKGYRQLRSRKERQENGLWPSTTQTPEVVGGHLEGPHLEDREQQRPIVKTRVKFMERPSITDRLAGIRQGLVRLSRMALFVITCVPMHLRHDGVDQVIKYPHDDAYEARRGAAMAYFDKNQRHAAVVGRCVHEDVVAHDGNAISGPKGRREKLRPPKRRRPRPLDQRQLGRLVFRLVGVVCGKAAAAHTKTTVG